jgi:predicted  nucleic acid-binding Zn-ribbon protein
MCAYDNYEDRLDELQDALRHLREKVARLERRVGLLEDERKADKERQGFKAMFGDDPLDGLEP